MGVSPRYKTSDVAGVGGRCLPADPAQLATAFDKVASPQIIQEIFADFHYAWREMLYIIAGAFGVTLILVFMMRCWVAPLVYIVLISAWAGLGVLTYFLFAAWKRLQDQWDDHPADRYDSDKRNLMFFKVTMIISLIIFLIVTLVLIAMRERIRLAVNVLEEASAALAFMPQVFLSPVLTYVWLFIFFAYWLAVFMYLSTSSTPYMIEGSDFVHYRYTGYYDQMWWYHLFGLFWTSEFILACEELVIAGCVATWYFTRDKSKMSHSLSKSIGRTIMYHLGSAALGSLIIAVIQVGRQHAWFGKPGVFLTGFGGPPDAPGGASVCDQEAREAEWRQLGRLPA